MATSIRTMSTTYTYNPFIAIWTNIMSIICDIHQFIADIQRMMRRANKAYTQSAPALTPDSAHTSKRVLDSRSLTTATVHASKKAPSPERPLGLDLDASILRKFLADMGFDTSQPRIPQNMRLEAAAIAAFEAEGLTPEFFEPLKRTAPMLAAAIDMPFNDHPFDVKLYLTLYCTLFLYIDDRAQNTPVQTVPELSTFVTSLGGDRAKAKFKNPNIAHFFRLVCEETPRYFGPIAAAAIAKTSLDFLLACLLESKLPQGLACVPETASRFPRYLRLKSGGSESFAYFLFPEALFPEKDCLEMYLPAMPDLIEITDMVNDILSFYKESVVGHEENNFFMNSARIHNISPVQLLQETAAKQKKLAADISATLSKRPDMKKTFETYIKGYIMWHCCQKRYRLSELGIELGAPAPIRRE